MRPIVGIMTVNFSPLALDQILNTAATIRHISGGRFRIPLGHPRHPARPVAAPVTPA